MAGCIPRSTADGPRSWPGQGDVALACAAGQWTMHSVTDRSHKMPGSSFFIYFCLFFWLAGTLQNLLHRLINSQK